MAGCPSDVFLSSERARESGGLVMRDNTAATLAETCDRNCDKYNAADSSPTVCLEFIPCIVCEDLGVKTQEQCFVHWFDEGPSGSPPFLFSFTWS